MCSLTRRARDLRERGACALRVPSAAMSVAGLMYCYGGALVGAGLLGLDKGVPAAGPAPLLPLSAGLGGAMLLFGYLSTPSGPQPPRKGERGFGLCVAAAVACCDAGCAERSTRLQTLQVHGGGAPGSAHAARVRRCVAGVLTAASRALRLLLCGAAVFAYRAYTARAFTHNAGSLAGLSVRARCAWRAAQCSRHHLLSAQLGSVVTFLWLVALKPKKKVE